MPVCAKKIHIGGADGPGDLAVAHRTAIDEDILRQRIGAMPGRQAGEAPEMDALAFGLDLQGVVAEFTTENLGQPRQRPLAIGGQA